MGRIQTLALFGLVGCVSESAIYANQGDDEGNVQVGVRGEDPTFACPVVPEDIELIPDLAFGWAHTDDDAIRLRLSTHAMPCDLPIRDAYAKVTACPSMWAIEIRLSEEAVAAGTHVLDAGDEATLVQSSPTPDHRGCTRQEVTSSAIGFSGTLRFHGTTKTCILGELVDVRAPSSTAPVLHGAFVAQRC